MDLGHELFHVLVAMISRHVVVEVLPDSLDPVVVRAIRRQEVEPHLSAPARQGQLHLAAVMDLVVVEDDVDPSGRSDS